LKEKRKKKKEKNPKYSNSAQNLHNTESHSKC
jgi:hypothetical protein